MLNFKQIDEARKLLGLGEEATLEEIKQAYRKLCLKYHPDKCKKKDKKHCEEMIKKINKARDIILSYCANFRYPFREKEVRRNITEKNRELYEHFRRFYDGWWGNLDL